MEGEKRSRRGCKQCRSGHHKCDEGTPKCRRCQARDIACEYVTRVKWNGILTVDIARRKRASASVVSRSQNVAPKSPSPSETSASLGDSACLSTSSSLGFQEPGEIAAYTYYVDRLAGELQAQDGLNNPYRKLSSVALSFPVLLHSIISCAAEHMHIGGHWPIQQAISQHDRAIRLIRAQLVDWKPSLSSSTSSKGSPNGDINADQAMLAAILLQPAIIAFSDGAASSAQTYLDIAFYVLNELKYFENSSTMDSFFPRLLIQRFAMVDVGLSVYGRRRPRTPLHNWFAQPSTDNVFDEGQPSFHEMTGCPHLVFTYLLRVMHLAADIFDCSRDKKDVYNDAIVIETELRVYDKGQVNSQSLVLQNSDASTGSIARAFTYAVILLLLRRVFAEPSSSPRVQHTVSTIFRLIDSTPTTRADTTSGAHSIRSGVDSASGLPFYLAARDAITIEDQNWVRQKHERWRKVYPNPARVRLMEVAERIWLERQKGLDDADSICEGIEISCEAYLF